MTLLLALQGGAPPPAFTLTADAGAFAVTGTVASLVAGRRMTADAGSIIPTGSAANPIAGYRLTGAAGSYAIAGPAASLLISRTIQAVAGSFALTGMAASLMASRRLSAASGAWILAGTDATLIVAGSPPAPAPADEHIGSHEHIGGWIPWVPLARTRRAAHRLLTATPGRYRVVGSPATLTLHPAEHDDDLLGVTEPDREESLLALV